VARAAAACLIRLPAFFSGEGLIDRTIRDLEQVCIEKHLDKWQESPWLKGELFLVVDEQYQARLGNYRLTYNREYGLMCERTED
jgi:hypothetical protein